MTIAINSDQEEAIRDAIRAGRVASIEELIDRAIEGLSQQTVSPKSDAAGRTVFEQGLGLFVSPADAALLDEVVLLAYTERRRPSQREPTA